jgi:DNA-binding protein H-NS
MNVIGMNMYPHIELLEENRRELERERQLRQQIREARAARRAERPSRFAALTARLRRPLQSDPCPPLVEEC